jgi:outer membrane protein TolC
MMLLFAHQIKAADVLYSEFSRIRQQEALPLTLDEAIALGVRSNRGIQTAYLQRISQKFDLYVSEGKFLPKLTLTSGMQSNIANGLSSLTKEIATNATLDLPTGAKLLLTTMNGLGASSSSQSTTSVRLTQPLLKNSGFVVNTATVHMARLDEQINRLSLIATLSLTVVQIVSTYRELLRAQEQRMIAEAALQRSRDLYQVNKALISTGRMAEVEIIQTEAEVANREVALEETENQIDASRLALLNLLALEPRTLVVAVGTKDIRLRDTDLAQALATALANHPDYLITQLQSERAKINLDYAKNQQLWDVSLVAGKTQSRGSTGGLVSVDATQTTAQKNETSYAGIQLTVPFGDRSIEQAAVRASVELKSQKLRMLETRQIIEQRIRDAVRNVQTRWRQLELSNKARDLSLLKLNAEKEKLQVGRTSNFQILSFENDLRNAENARVNAEIAYLNALTDLDDRMGKTLDTWTIPVIEPELSSNEY